MTRARLAIWAVMLLAGLLCGQVRAKVSPGEVDEAIRKAVAYLYSQQKGDNWEVVPQRDPKAAHHEIKGWQWGGVSALATCALLYAGEKPNDERLKRAIEWLANAEIYGTYALGFRCQVWAMIPPTDAIGRVARRDADHLMAAVFKDGRSMGYFPYAFADGKAIPGGNRNDQMDHSVSQYGVLGLWACAQLNVEIDMAYWRAIEAAWRAGQYPSGAWAYRWREDRWGGSKSPDWGDERLSMTAAGVASLFITQEYLHSMEGLNASVNISDEHIDRGLKWISERFNDYKSARTYYTLYGLERIGVASGYKYFNRINWYEDGAEYLVGRQKEDGSWGEGDEKSNDNPNRICDTAFGLMFLSRGRAPVIINKLNYDVQLAGGKSRPGLWNQRPREIANVSRWIGRQIERDLNWQIVTLDAPVEELLDAPVLWISGKETLNFSSEEKARLKAYVEAGGLIVGNANNANALFANSYRKLGEELFGGKFRELPADHVIYTSQVYKKSNWRRNFSVLGLSNGARELMLLVPQADPARSWQMREFRTNEVEPLAQFMANVVLYAVDKTGLRVKGQSYWVARDQGKTPRQSVKVARLQYDGAWDPEPGGWRRLANIMHNDHDTELKVETVKLGAGALKADYKMAHLTGTGNLKLTAAQRDELRTFVDNGGLLVVDAAGDSEGFRAAARAELEGIFKPEKGLVELAKDHAIYTTGNAITEVSYRVHARRKIGTSRTPMLKGIEKDGRVRVIFSEEDLSVGLVGQPVDGIFGYEPASATAIMTNLVLYSARK